MNADLRVLVCKDYVQFKLFRIKTLIIVRIIYLKIILFPYKNNVLHTQIKQNKNHIRTLLDLHRIDIVRVMM